MKKKAILLLIAFLVCVFCLPNALPAKATSAECMITIESSSGRVLYAKNEHKKRPMASVTKILTAISVLENCKDLEKVQTVPAKAQGIEGSSIYLQGGEKISTLDLLYGLMLQSGNDCAVALAILTSNSVEEFAALMNQTAKKAGAKNSNFVNPHGLHDDNHYSTAYDLAVITAYAMNNPIFKEIVSSKTRRIQRTRQDAPTLIPNKNRLLNTLEGADGVKTGFTKRAGRCLVASATKNGMQIISVVLNCGPMFEDCASLINRAFSEYSLVKVAEKNQKAAELDILDGRHKTISVGITKDLYYPLKKGEEITAQVQPVGTLYAPIKKGQRLGKIFYKLDNRLLFCEDLYSIEFAPSMSYTDFLKRSIKEL